MFSNLPLFPQQASSVSGEVDALYLFLVGVTIFFSTLIALLIIYFAIRYRRRAESERPEPIHGSMALEITWTVIPLMLCMVMFGWGAKVYFEIVRPPAGALEVFVVGKQWMWKVQHANGQREINELHIPVGRAVRLTMASEDVIHSFFVPAFRVKADVVPGKYRITWFQATKPGRYHLFCAEYCGTKHAGMGGWIMVMEPAQFEAWLAGSPQTGSAVTSGQKLFQDLACITCHKNDGSGRGPVLAGLYRKTVHLANNQSVVADENYIRESIVNPQARMVVGFEPVMPTFQGQISEEGLLQLIAYIKSLSPPQQETPPAGNAAEASNVTGTKK